MKIISQPVFSKRCIVTYKSATTDCLRLLESKICCPSSKLPMRYSKEEEGFVNWELQIKWKVKDGIVDLIDGLEGIGENLEWKQRQERLVKQIGKKEEEDIY